MADPVLTFVLLAAFFVTLTAASYFKTLETELWRDAQLPLIAGLVCGAIIFFSARVTGLQAAVTGVILTVAALYVRLTGRESEPADGMALGAMTGAFASIPLIFRGYGELLAFAECILAGAVAGYGITFGLTHVRDRMKQALIDAFTAALAVALAYLPSMLTRSGVAAREVAIGAAAIVPLLLVITVFKQWPTVRGELRHEAALNVIDDSDVRPTAHPFLRLGRAGWHDARAHRQFVRLANKIALRQRQQRGRSEEVARLYQLEVIKLRMELQEMTRIDRAMRAAASREQTVS
jgi:hypothetical protein